MILEISPAPELPVPGAGRHGELRPDAVEATGLGGEGNQCLNNNKNKTKQTKKKLDGKDKVKVNFYLFGNAKR